MTRTMKPRQIFTEAYAGQLTSIEVDGVWHNLGRESLTLIGTRQWTVRDADGTVITRCSGNTEFRVR